MTDLDRRAARAAAAVRSASADVALRDIAMLATRRRRTLAAGSVIAVVAAAAVVALFVVRPGKGPAGNVLNPAAPLPPGVKSKSFSPAGVGVTVQIPDTWVSAPPQSGFDFVMRQPITGGDFLLVTRSPVQFSTQQMLDHQKSSLTSRGATVDNTRIGVIQGHPAVMLHYRLKAPTGRTVEDTEYDIIDASRGAIVVAIGAPDGHADQRLINWIASTIKPDS